MSHELGGMTTVSVEPALCWLCCVLWRPRLVRRFTISDWWVRANPRRPREDATSSDKNFVAKSNRSALAHLALLLLVVGLHTSSSQPRHSNTMQKDTLRHRAAPPPPGHRPPPSFSAGRLDAATSYLRAAAAHSLQGLAAAALTNSHSTLPPSEWQPAGKAQASQPTPFQCIASRPIGMLSSDRQHRYQCRRGRCRSTCKCGLASQKA